MSSLPSEIVREAAEEDSKASVEASNLVAGVLCTATCVGNSDVCSTGTTINTVVQSSINSTSV